MPRPTQGLTTAVPCHVPTRSPVVGTWHAIGAKPARPQKDPPLPKETPLASASKRIVYYRTFPGWVIRLPAQPVKADNVAAFVKEFSHARPISNLARKW